MRDGNGPGGGALHVHGPVASAKQEVSRRMNMVVAIALGGALGALGRHVVGSQLSRLLGTDFPWGTLTVNVVGSFVMGALVELMALKIQVSPEVRAFLTVGLLGGFTTFSAFSLEVALLYERAALGLALAYVLVSLIASIGGLFVGLWLARVALA
jgi:fluoride exporter